MNLNIHDWSRKILEEKEPASDKLSEGAVGEHGNQPETSGGYPVFVARMYLATLAVLEWESQMSSIASSSGINSILEAFLAGHARRAW